ncbi:MAG TPA: hypothetical protein VNU97_04900 [Rhizomicrobium sp.]|jgi:hypothetical protein|nr:hypothetical protein [Rhizomicrobium sp.]
MSFVRTATLLGAALLLAACGKAPPTDKDMQAAFFARRATFEALRTDLCKLRYDQTIMRDWVQPQMPAADEKRFRAQLEAIGASGVKYVRGCQLWIQMWSSGVGRDAAFKKFRYGPPLFRIIEVKEPPPKDLNTYLDSRVRIASFEKNIVGDWWIELDHWQ